MSTYESPKELRRRVKEAARRAEEQDLRTEVHRGSWIKDLGREFLYELPNTLTLQTLAIAKDQHDLHKRGRGRSGPKSSDAQGQREKKDLNAD